MVSMMWSAPLTSQLQACHKPTAQYTHHICPPAPCTHLSHVKRHLLAASIPPKQPLAPPALLFDSQRRVQVAASAKLEQQDALGQMKVAREQVGVRQANGAGNAWWWLNPKRRLATS